MRFFPTRIKKGRLSTRLFRKTSHGVDQYVMVDGCHRSCHRLDVEVTSKEGGRGQGPRVMQPSFRPDLPCIPSTSRNERLQVSMTTIHDIPHRAWVNYQGWLRNVASLSEAEASARAAATQPTNHGSHLGVCVRGLRTWLLGCGVFPWLRTR
ncbi:hypothetical protein OPQ81_006245 [Rhizoctonia solani]|nr:hypothetical protein OPQ81_006245 [Rhizoctonia solani]